MTGIERTTEPTSNQIPHHFAQEALVVNDEEREFSFASQSKAYRSLERTAQKINSGQVSLTPAIQNCFKINQRQPL